MLKGGDSGVGMAKGALRTSNRPVKIKLGPNYQIKKGETK